jgi:two-component system phosphate regulon sensor histidine kinase PhoR
MERLAADGNGGRAALRAAAAVLAAASAAVLLLVAAGVAAPAWAAAGAAGAGAAAWALARLVLGDVADLERAAAAVADDPSAPPPPTPEAATAAGRRAQQAAQRAHRAWRRRLDRLVREQDALQSIFEALHDPILVIDSRRRVVRANSAASELFGDRVRERDLAASLRHPGVLDAVEKVLDGGASRTLEFSIPVPVEMTFEARVTPFRVAGPVGDDDEPPEDETTVILTLHEITAIKRSEQMRADFVANASHELRTPLSALLGFIETLRGPARDDADARQRFLAIMADQAGRMSRLVNDLLSLSRIELDERTAPTGRADVGRLLRAAADGLELRAAARGVSVVMSIPHDAPPVVGDPDQLAQVFQNLLDNAIKYGREETPVEVTVSVTDGPPSGPSAPAPGQAPPQVRGRPRGRLVAVSVRDHGDGIPRAHLPRLTERFYRVDAARSRQMGGTGLGLAIVKHIVNRHRGRLTIESDVGKGSTFTVYLPAVPAGEPAARADAAPAPAPIA